MKNTLAILANIALLPLAFFYDLARLILNGKPEPRTLGGMELV